MISTKLRQKRQLAGLSLSLVSMVSGIDCATLSLFERGLVSISEEKVKKIIQAIDELGAKRRLIENYTAEVGWPMSLRS
jgi:transcriptional regulator with XRE-family HTH domain